MLSDEHIERYSRQIILPQVGGKGQEKLLRARVFVSANASLRTAALHYLAAAGVGTLGVFADSQDSSLALLASPQEPCSFHFLTRLNPDCLIIPHPTEDARFPQQLVGSYDIVLSDSDVLHDDCYTEQRPFLYAPVSDAEAWLMSCRGYEANSPCLRCVPTSLVSNSHASLFSEVAALFMGAHLATEAIKHLLGLPQSRQTNLLHFQFSSFHCTETAVKKSPTCPLCRPSFLGNS